MTRIGREPEWRARNPSLYRVQSTACLAGFVLLSSCYHGTLLHEVPNILSYKCKADSHGKWSSHFKSSLAEYMADDWSLGHHSPTDMPQTHFGGLSGTFSGNMNAMSAGETNKA